MTLDLTRIPAGADYDLILYDETLDFVAFSRNHDQEDEQLSYTHPRGQREAYYIRIFMDKKSATNENTYRLRIQVD